MKQIEITKFLEWAYRLELPKVERAGDGIGVSVASSWGMVASYGMLGTVIDAPLNSYGVVPVSMDEGDPHPDAMAVAQAVIALGCMRVGIGASWTPFPEWADGDGLVAEAVARVRARMESMAGAEVQTMLIARAVLGRKPDWRGQEPGRVMVMRNGRPAWFMKEAGQDAYGNHTEREVDGWNPRSRRPRPGAYRKQRLTGDVCGLAVDRFRRTVWACAVRHLRRELVSGVYGPLTAHVISDVVPTMAPWAVVSGVEDAGDPCGAVSLFL